MNGHFAFYRGISLVSKAIKWFTRSNYSHVSYIDGSGQVYEAWPPRARITPSYNVGHAAGTIIDLYRCPMSPTQEATMVAYLTGCIGIKYDFAGVLGFISRRAGAQRQDKLFCSEMIVDACRAAGVILIERTPSYAISPGHLSTSPLLSYSGSVVA